jgi:hypothetical protein
MAKRGIRRQTVDLPLVDEEYAELVAVYQAALQAKETFTAIEMGARWGTWGSRTVSFLRRFNPAVHSHDVLYFEPDVVAAGGLKMVHHLNGITNFTLHTANARADVIAARAATKNHIDLVDIDIQGAEESLVPELAALLRSKVKRVIIGTHSAATHAKLSDFVRHQLKWTVVSDMPMSKDTGCVQAHYRDAFNIDMIKKQGCYHVGPFGKVVQWDGEIIADNPALRAEESPEQCFV